MAEGTEKEVTENGKDHQKSCHQQHEQNGPLSFKLSSTSNGIKTEEEASMSSTESLTLLNDSETSTDELIVLNCSSVNKSNLLTRERSKTPPPIISHEFTTNSTTFASFNNENNNNLKKNEEKSRDSGVHLDEMSNNLGSGDPSRTTVGGINGSIDGESTNSIGVVNSSGGSNSEVDPSRRHLKSSSLPHGVKLCPESTTRDSISASGSNGNEKNVAASLGSLSDREDERWLSLEEELRKAQFELKEKDAEVEILKGIRTQVEGELEDLTASLFEEAHKMVKEAKMKEVASEKSFKEAKMQLEGLQAEVAALKALLITSTPSRPNLGGGNGISLFKKQHKRTPSHNHLQYGRADEETNGSEKESRTNEVVIDRSRCDVDPILLSHFAAWRVEPNLSREKTLFLQKMYTEDIDPCLCFANESLVIRLKKAIEDNSIWVEPLPEKDRTNVPKDCALLCCPRVCHYRMRFAFESEEWFQISQICRDRIAAVCEFLNYLRYIKNGLVKASVDDAYWEMLRLRKQIGMAKLGISIS